jgi:YfiH family protein
MIRKEKEGVEWLEFELLQGFAQLKHGVFLRHGGVSTAPFSSLNAITHTGDCFEKVQENRKKILGTLDLKKLIFKKQIHSTEIAWIKEIQNETHTQIASCDGLMTALPHHGLMTVHADCQAAIFYDPIHHALASVHAGWRGQVQNIYAETIFKMKSAFQSNPKELLVTISPSLGPENSEFKNYKTELPQEFWPFQIKPTYFDLWAIARYQLEKAGVLPHHIQIAQIDTYANSQDFFSFRRERALGPQGNIYGCHATISYLL